LVTVTSLSSGSHISSYNKMPFPFCVFLRVPALCPYRLYLILSLHIAWPFLLYPTVFTYSPIPRTLFLAASFFPLRGFSHVHSSSHSHFPFSLSAWPPSSVSYLLVSKPITCCVILTTSIRVLSHAGRLHLNLPDASVVTEQSLRMIFLRKLRQTRFYPRRVECEKKRETACQCPTRECEWLFFHFFAPTSRLTQFPRTVARVHDCRKG